MANLTRRCFLKASATLAAGLVAASALPVIGPLAQKAHDHFFTFKGIPLVWDQHCSTNRLYAVSEATATRLREGKWLT